VAAYPPLERVELMRLDDVVLISIQPAWQRAPTTAARTCPRAIRTRALQHRGEGQQTLAVGRRDDDSDGLADKLLLPAVASG
jgi:hypothetical protein